MDIEVPLSSFFMKQSMIRTWTAHEIGPRGHLRCPSDRDKSLVPKPVIRRRSSVEERSKMRAFRLSCVGENCTHQVRAIEMSRERTHLTQLVFHREVGRKNEQ